MANIHFRPKMSQNQNARIALWQSRQEEAENFWLTEIAFPQGRFTRDTQRSLALVIHKFLDDPAAACYQFRMCIQQNPRNIDCHLVFAKILSDSLHRHEEAIAVCIIRLLILDSPSAVIVDILLLYIY